MLMGHLLCGVMFGALLATACLLLGISLLSALSALVLGANVGLGASLRAQAP